MLFIYIYIKGKRDQLIYQHTTQTTGWIRLKFSIQVAIIT